VTAWDSVKGSQLRSDGSIWFILLINYYYYLLLRQVAVRHTVIQTVIYTAIQKYKRVNNHIRDDFLKEY